MSDDASTEPLRFSHPEDQAEWESIKARWPIRSGVDASMLMAELNRLVDRACRRCEEDRP